jgi:hypothetical protein
MSYCPEIGGIELEPRMKKTLRIPEEDINLLKYIVQFPGLSSAMKALAPFGSKMTMQSEPETGQDLD